MKEKKKEKEPALTRLFREHIEDALKAGQHFGPRQIAKSFNDANENLLKGMDLGLRLSYLSRLAGDIIRMSSLFTERPAKTQLRLPVGFENLDIPQAITYVNDKGEEKVCLTAFAHLPEILSHEEIRNKNATAAAKGARHYSRFVTLIRPTMERNPKLNATQALKLLQANDQRAG